MIALFLVCPTAWAADIYLTPSGAGRRDGTSWENAFDRTLLGTVVNERMQPGDRLLVGGGIYAASTLTISKGGMPGSAKTITGVDLGDGLPVFVGEWSITRPASGATAVRIEPGVSHVALASLPKRRGNSHGRRRHAAGCVKRLSSFRQ